MTFLLLELIQTIFTIHISIDLLSPLLLKSLMDRKTRSEDHRLASRTLLVLVYFDCLGHFGRKLVFDFFSTKLLVIKAEIYKMLHERPRSDCFFRSSLIWVCSVCLSHFSRKLVFEILEH